jgi:hypothetical protein
MRSSLLALLLLSLGCGPAHLEGRQTTAAVAQSDDPCLLGARCTPDTPFDPAPRIETVAAGSGDPVAPGETVRIHYVAALPDGTRVHDSHETHMPSEIILGSTKVMCGVERSLVGMRPGEERRVLVPWSLAFGEEGRPPSVPPRADLLFVIDLYLPADIVNEKRGRPVNPAGGGGRRR